jgi:hypothetical protein
MTADDGAVRGTRDGAAPPVRWVAYDFAVLRVLAHPHDGVFIPVGVVVHARTAEFLGMRVLCDAAELARRIRDVDAELLARYLAAAQQVCAGTESHGPVALTSPSERFHWLTAPRSDVIQASPVHEGVCRDPAAELERLFGMYVGG